MRTVLLCQSMPHVCACMCVRLVLLCTALVCQARVPCLGLSGETSGVYACSCVMRDFCVDVCSLLFVKLRHTHEHTHAHTQPAGCDTSRARSRFVHFPLILDRVRSGSGRGSHKPRRFPEPEMGPLHVGSRPNIIRKLTVTACACARRRTRVTRETRCTSTGVCSVRTCRAVSKAAQSLWSHHPPRPTTSMERALTRRLGNLRRRLCLCSPLLEKRRQKVFVSLRGAIMITIRRLTLAL